MSRQRDPGKERFWRRVLQDWRRSGLSVREFCADRGLSEASLYWWRRTLEQEDAQATRLVPVRVIPETAELDRAAASRAAGEADGGPAGLELIIAGGRRLRIGAGFDESTLRRLLAMLEEGRPCS